MNQSKKNILIALIAFILIITAGWICRSEIKTIFKEFNIRVNFDSSQGNKLTPEGYAPEVVGDSYSVPVEDSKTSNENDSNQQGDE